MQAYCHQKHFIHKIVLCFSRNSQCLTQNYLGGYSLSIRLQVIMSSAIFYWFISANNVMYGQIAIVTDSSWRDVTSMLVS